jgi:serine protease Do
VIITADGYVVTNNHVVENAKEDGIEVVMHDKLRFRAKVVGTDPSTDLAVLKIDAKDLAAVAFGNSDNVQVGEWVLAVGNPLGLTSTVTQGIISAIGRDINIIQGQYGIENFIQTDAAINPGNSGGALVNLSGELVGINAAIATTNARYQGYGFAIPVNLVRTVATDLIRYGEVRRGYIGVQISPLDETVASSIGMKEAKGVFVQSVVEGGAGADAGLRERDVILSVDGKEVNSPNALQSTIATHHPGDAVILKVYREGKILEKKVVLRPRSDEQIAEQREGEGKDSGETSAGGSKTAEFGKLGLTVRNLTPEEKKELGVENGVLVADVAAYSEAFKRGIGRDDVVLEADQKPVRSTDDLKAIIDKRKPGDAVLLRVKRDQGAPAYVAVQIPR